MTTFHLSRSAFDEVERPAVEHGSLKAGLFRYPTGVEAIHLENARGALIVLPYLGQMIWQAAFDGVDLTMKSIFKAPRRVPTVGETYGCFAFHSGLLRNGVPGPTDNHPSHGEMPCAAMDWAGIEAGHDERGDYLRVVGTFEYAMGFGSHYLARPSVTLHAGSARFDMAMEVTNLSAGDPMDLMYMCHVNYAFSEGAEILQQTPFTPDRTVTRTAVPAHVRPNPTYLARVAALAADPAGSRVVRTLLQVRGPGRELGRTGPQRASTFGDGAVAFGEFVSTRGQASRTGLQLARTCNQGTRAGLQLAGTRLELGCTVGKATCALGQLVGAGDEFARALTQRTGAFAQFACTAGQFTVTLSKLG